jgi:F-type H+/Na+-transporting ATPase subunit alpha
VSDRLKVQEASGLKELAPLAEDTFSIFDRLLEEHEASLEPREVGVITYVGHGIAGVSGLAGARSEELLRFPGDVMGLVFNLDEDEIGVVLLGSSDRLGAGAEVYRTGRVLDVPVGDELLGRVIDALGRPLDDQGSIHTGQRLPVERSAPAMTDRTGVKPLQTGMSR